MAMENHMEKKVESEGLSFLQVVAEGVLLCHPSCEKLSKWVAAQTFGRIQKGNPQGLFEITEDWYRVSTILGVLPPRSSQGFVTRDPSLLIPTSAEMPLS